VAEVTAHPGPGSAADRARAIARRQADERGESFEPAVAPPIGPAVVLIGPPGSGKSTVGAAIARITGLPLRDIDSDIEHRTGRTIPEIFVEDGEPHFRALERDAVAVALAEHSGVLALGGGAILADETRAMLARHPVIYLSLSMPTGVRRTGLAANRPLLAGVNPRATYKALLEARIPLYREVAALEIDTDQLSAAEVALIIIEKLELQ
jgi:shikimate kinase